MDLFIMCIWITLILSVSASMTLLGFQTQTKITTTNLKCLQNKNYLEEVFIQLYRDGDIISSIDQVLLKQFSVQPHAIIILFESDTYYPEGAITKWTNHLITHNYKSLWITWSFGGGYKIDCEGVWKIITALKKLTPNQFGVFMSSYRWNSNGYLNLPYCQRLSQFPLFAEDEKQFQPFEGWNSYALKVKQTLNGICQINKIQQIQKMRSWRNWENNLLKN